MSGCLRRRPSTNASSVCIAVSSILLLLVLELQIQTTTAFTLYHPAATTTTIFSRHVKTSSSSPSSLQMIQDNNDNNENENEDPEIAMERNIQRTSIQQFLTQRSIQSFMFLCEQVRDPHTADWVERLLGKTDLLNYHGTGAFNVTRFPTWDAFFGELIEQPQTSIIVQAKRRGRGHGGWSKVRIEC